MVKLGAFTREQAIQKVGEAHFNVMAAGKMNPRQTAAVSPVNWNASQMLGMKFAPTKTRAISPAVSMLNLTLSSSAKGFPWGNNRPSMLIRKG
ncbi:hypothetical protein SAY87_008904 [Trapa incisa]|uniref:Uncharacterized protein n=1 Tax=Trapa incisa TaxID=236973 RepID=A0AAN7PVW1_9MYRT|nr:hypothetical protein SAY87_008904 [Trapa incisa]